MTTTRLRHVRLVAVLLVAAVTVPAMGAGAVAGARSRAPRVDDVALEAVAALGADAPVAVVAALADGTSLEAIVRRIEDGTLAAVGETATTTTAATTGTTAGGDATTGNDVVALGEGGFSPERIMVDPSAPLIVANRGKRVHVIEIKGSDLQKFSIEPGQVGVYELEDLPPGRYTLRCIVAGHEERAVLVVPDPPTSGLRSPVGGRSAALRTPARRASGEVDLDTLTDYLERFAMFDAVVVEMSEDGAQALEEAAQMRERAARAQEKLDDGGDDPTTASPRRVVQRAEKEGVDPEATLLTTAILMAAHNGYDAGQITEFLVDEALDPVWETGQGPLRKRDAFLAGGVILGVVPRNAPAEGVFRADAPKSRTSDGEGGGGEGDDEGGAAADGEIAAGTYEGEFTGALLETALEVSASPGPPRAIRNTVDVKVDEDGTMRFTLALAMSASWVSRDDTVTCDSQQSYFATVTPRPTARLKDDGTFESTQFRSTVRQTDFTGPECGSHVYSGENDGEFTSRVVGSVDGDTIRGTIRIADEEGGGDLEFSATRR